MQPYCASNHIKLGKSSIDVEENAYTDRWSHYQTHILSHISESLMVLDTKGKVLFCNRKGQELLSSVSAEIGSIDIPQDILSIKDLSSLEAANSWQGEVVLQINGTSRHFIHCVDAWIENGNHMGFIVVSTDITELVANREQVQAAMARSQFLANISHEIRTPMIGILGAVNLLEESKLNDIQRENVRIIQECGEQLLNIINDILDTSKIELGLVKLYPKPCNLLNLFNHLISNIEPLLKEKGLEIKLDISPDIPGFVLIDETKLRQILINLLDNAIKFTKRGFISFATAIIQESEIDWLCITICDTGIGIPDYEVAKIFNPFTQVDDSSSRQYGGTGLGLYLCKKLVDLMQGKITINSQIGLGTTVYCQLPVKTVSKPEVSNAPNYDYDDPYVDRLLLGFNPVKVLLVEDNELNQKIVLQMLINYGFEVTTAANGLDCLRLLQENRYDVILMDMQMPVMDGYEATRMIRQYEELKNIPIIAMTAHAMAGDREKCLANGCTSYIAKPFKAEELAQVIRQHISSSESTKANQKQELNGFINELLPEFMEQLDEMIGNLQSALKEHNLSTIKSISHDIKGTAGMYGFNQISAIAAQVEEAAREHSFANIEYLLGELHEVYKQVNVKVG